MKTIEVSYSAYLYVDVPNDWEADTHEKEILQLAYEQHEDNPDGHWEIVTEEDEDE
jgi:hypothetical protein